MDAAIIQVTSFPKVKSKSKPTQETFFLLKAVPSSFSTSGGRRFQIPKPQVLIEVQLPAGEEGRHQLWRAGAGERPFHLARVFPCEGAYWKS